METKLNDRQQRFVAEYLIDLNASKAALRAGYSEKTAYSIGHENLSKPEIQAAIAQAQAERSERTQITQDTVLRDIELVKQDAMQKVPDKEGNMVMLNHSAALKSLELQGKHVGMFSDKIEVSGTLNMMVSLDLAEAIAHEFIRKPS